MSVAKRIIFPALRLAIWAVIAIALVLIAIRPSGQGSANADPLEPDANFTYSTVAPMRGDVSNKVSFSGQIVPDASIEVKATSSGTVHKFWLGDGAEVQAGAPLIVLRQLLGDGTDENLYTTSTIWANTSGRVTIDVKSGEEVTIDQVVAKITSGTYIVEADIEPHQMYQLGDAPATAEVTITNGPPTFTCKSFTTTVITGEENVSVKGRCFVPADVLVFPGLSATVEMVTESATDVLLVPITAVEGLVGEGTVWRLASDGQIEEVVVGLGLSDGEMIEITSGLSESDEVLLYAMNNPEGEFGFFPEEGYEEEFFNGEELEG